MYCLQKKIKHVVSALKGYMKHKQQNMMMEFKRQTELKNLIGQFSSPGSKPFIVNIKMFHGCTDCIMLQLQITYCTLITLLTLIRLKDEFLLPVSILTIVALNINMLPSQCLKTCQLSGHHTRTNEQISHGWSDTDIS